MRIQATHTPAACALLGACVLVSAAPAAASETPTPGWSVGSLSVPPPVALDPFGLGFDVVGMRLPLSSGDVLTFDGRDLLRVDPLGGTVPLASLLEPTFPSLLEPSPSEAFVLLGESSDGELYRFDLPAGPLTPLGQLAYNFDAAFTGELTAIVSAAGCIGCDSELWQVDLVTGSRTLVAEVPGPSGPVAADATGALYYAVQSAVFGGTGDGVSCVSPRSACPAVAY